MIERTRKLTGAPFYGCSRFPVCVGTRPIGEGTDSYTMLLRTAYLKALVALGSPQLLGPTEASEFLLSNAKFEGEDDLQNYSYDNYLDLPTSRLERSIDAAIQFGIEHGLNQDFLVDAHEERMTSITAYLQYGTNPEFLKNMEEPKIRRRYDTGFLEQLEAQITTDWKKDGTNCPRCGRWAETIEHTKPGGFFDPMAEPPRACAWDCVDCGKFTNVDGGYTYEQDKNDSESVPGVRLGMTGRRRQPDEDKIDVDGSEDARAFRRKR